MVDRTGSFYVTWLPLKVERGEIGRKLLEGILNFSSIKNPFSE